MPNSSIVTSFVKKDTSALSSSGLEDWAKLEQADIPKSAATATMKDAYAMADLAKSGRSAYDYILDACPYAKVAGGTITVKLDFYVWPSSLGLDYWLATNIGEISQGVLFRRERSFDVIFNSTASVDIGFLFDGSFVKEMPFFDDNGHVLDPQPTVTVDGTNVVLSTAATGVLRATVTAKGFKYTLTMKLSETVVTNTDPNTGNTTTIGGYDLNNLSASVMVVWGHCSPSDAICIELHSDRIQMDLPGCIGDLLNSCNGYPSSTLTVNGEDKPMYVVYYSACNGEILKKFWRDPQ